MTGFAAVYNTQAHTAASLPGRRIVGLTVSYAAIVAFPPQASAPEATGHGVSEVMDAVYHEHGRVPGDRAGD